MAHKDLALRLFDIGAVKIDFEKGWTLKSGKWSPIYINLRILQSFPDELVDTASLLALMVEKDKISYDRIASIPLAAVALGVALAVKLNKPHILPRMDNKKHGLGVKIDGVFEKGQRVLLVDDLITKATSKLEAIAELTAAGLAVKDVVVVVDREQGGREELEKEGYKLHAVIKFKDMLKILKENKRISGEIYGKLITYLEEN
jgi:uridine monophosphate synthetase